MTGTASFSVTLWEPQGSDAPEAGPEQSRVRIHKAFEGDLVGKSTGEGLFCGMSTPEDGAGYVVSERFVGRLGQREGSFVIQHGGLMGPGQPPHTFGSVVPGSGTGGLSGLAGTVEISRTDDGGHLLRLDYQIGG